MLAWQDGLHAEWASMYARVYFPPRWSLHSLVLSRHSQMLEESYLDRIERLAFKDQQQVSATRQALAQTVYADCTFQPTINPRSARIAKVRPHAYEELWL